VNHYLLGIYVRANASVRTNCEVMLVQFDATFYLSINIQIFAAGELALHYHGFADMGNIGTTLLAGSIGVHGTDLLIPLAGQAGGQNTGLQSQDEESMPQGES